MMVIVCFCWTLYKVSMGTCFFYQNFFLFLPHAIKNLERPEKSHSSNIPILHNLFIPTKLLPNKRERNGKTIIYYLKCNMLVAKHQCGPKWIACRTLCLNSSSPTISKNLLWTNINKHASYTFIYLFTIKRLVKFK